VAQCRAASSVGIMPPTSFQFKLQFTIETSYSP
jgi:hypothetical protein